MSDDLIERLRETIRLHTERARSGEAYDGFELRAFADEVMEAADALAAKGTALSEMRAELEAMKTKRDAWRRVAERSDDERHAAEAELERVKKALEQVRALFIVERDANVRSPSIGYASDSLPKIVAILDRALAPSIQDEVEGNG